jgi:hypothetical protein
MGMKKPFTELDAESYPTLQFLYEHLQKDEGTGKWVLKESPDGFFDDAKAFKREFVFDSEEEAELALRRFARHFMHGNPLRGVSTIEELRRLKRAAKETIAYRKNREEWLSLREQRVVSIPKPPKPNT